MQCLQIVQSDGFMNITLEDVLFTDALGNKSKFDSFFVQNRLIRSGEKRMQLGDEFHNVGFRCVQVPKQINMKEELKKYTDSLGAGRGRGRGRG